MSTRSGKRIHKSVHENMVSAEPEPPGDGKTRSRRPKANRVALNASLSKLKKKVNYVSYPSTDEEPGSGDSGKDVAEPPPPPPRALRKHALREIEVEPDQNNFAEPASDAEAKPKPTRMTRRTRKFADQNDELPSSQEPEQVETKRGKRNKKKKVSAEADTNEKENEAEEPPKKTTKKRKTKKVNAVIETKSPEIKVAANNSATSLDSFHSAAGSPTPASTEHLHGTFDKPASRRSSRTTLDLAKDVKIILEKVVTASPRRSSIKRNSIAAVEDSTFDNSTTAADTPVKANATFEKELSPKPQNSTFEKASDGTKAVTPSKNTRLSKATLDTTFEKDSNTKLDSTFDKNNDQHTTTDGANLTFDKSDENISRISITSDDSKSSEIIMNTTPVLIESSMETSQTLEAASPAAAPTTPLKREGTFTKDTSEVSMSPKPDTTPVRRQMSMPSPGRTPYLSGSKTPTRQKRPLNVTHSLEKSGRKLSLAEPPARGTRVMFCSPAATPRVDTQRKSKVIKSSMKGSNKSFVFQENETVRGSGRKRSLAASEAAPPSGAKRQRLASDLRQSVERLSRPKTSIAKPDATPSKKSTAPEPTKSSVKRGKLPNFAALHQKQFARMESLGECQQRRARRAKQLLVPTGSLAVLERISPKGTTTEPPKSTSKDESKKKDTQKETKAELAKPGYTRFGFKLNLDVNPFSITKAPSTVVKDPKPNVVIPFNMGASATVVKEPRLNGLKRQPLPSLVGATSVRKEVAKAVLCREKSATALRERREGKRSETRTIIKGVRTNRRFELQMRSRNI